jgi:integrase
VVQILALAERDRLIATNCARLAKRPRGEPKEIEILDEGQVREVLAKLHGRLFFPLVLLGIGTGMRRGEMLALRWKDVDFDKARLRIERSLEQTKAKPNATDELERAGLRFKAPKNRYSKRSIVVPSSVLIELKAHYARQAKQRLKLGFGRPDDDALVFSREDGSPCMPNSVTTTWRRLVKQLGLPKVSLHAWRHTHASQLIASGMDVLSVSRRLGHSSPVVTLSIYAHKFRPSDQAAAEAFETAFGKVLSNENKSTEPGQSENQIGGKLAVSGMVLHLPPPSSI